MLHSTYYKDLDQEILERSLFIGGFEGLLPSDPTHPAEFCASAAAARFRLIKEFQDTCAALFCGNPKLFDSIFHPGVVTGISPSVTSLIDTILPATDLVARTPDFFRTDEDGNGMVFEIQCPGSGWGEQALFEKVLLGQSNLLKSFSLSIRKKYGPDVILHHLFDNASVLHSNLLFCSYLSDPRDQHHLSVYGFSPGIRPKQANYIRTHLLDGLVSENFFSMRLPELITGNIRLDYPLNPIFESKVQYCLPFIDAFSSNFRPEIGKLFPYSTPVTQVMRLEDESSMTWREFCERPKSKRGYYLKYAGVDPSRNWGSMAVFNCAGMTTKKLLHIFSRLLEANEPWIIQKASHETQDVTYADRDLSMVTQRCYTRSSVFYGPDGPLAANTKYRRMSKVHGSSDTIHRVGVVV